MPEENRKERVDRELIELLNELRVALPGVQVLFAFLLIVPFSQRFAQITSPQRVAYFTAFACTSAATTSSRRSVRSSASSTSGTSIRSWIGS